MNDIHQPILAAKMPVIRQRLPFGDVPSVRMIKLERGLLQRSLLYCFEKGYFSLIRYLLQSGTTDAQERDHEGRTGLMYCCFIDNDCWAQNLALTLLEYGAKIEDQDQRGLNALHYAIITQRPTLIRRYLSSLDFNLHQTIDIHGNTLLHYASSTGNVDVLRLILNAMKHYSLDLTIKSHSGATAYDIACELNHERCQNLLRNELVLQRRRHLPSNVSQITTESYNDRRLSTLTRTRPITTSIQRTRSIVSVPLPVPNFKDSSRQRFPSISSIDKENALHSPSIFIDPIESRHMTLKRNETLDQSLANLAKNRAEFAPLPFISPSTVLNTSSATWRDDFSKVLNQLHFISHIHFLSSHLPV